MLLLKKTRLIAALLVAAAAVFLTPLGLQGAAKKPTEPQLNVKLGYVYREFVIELPDGGEIKNAKGRRIKSIKKGRSFAWSLPDKKHKRAKIKYINETLTVLPKKNIFIFNKKKYRGSLIIKISKTGAAVVNRVGLESYLRGVVGSEMGSQAPLESLKAQTVIARTYALANLNKHRADGADVCDSTHCQVYSGMGAERASIDMAVAATRSVIMVSDGKLVSALYHACCGGMTSDNDKVFGGAPQSYLRRVKCDYCKNAAKYRWTRSCTVKKLINELKKEKIYFSKVYDAKIESASYMDRVNFLVLQTDSGTKKIKGTTIRRIFDFPSTTFILGHRTAVKSQIENAQLFSQNTIQQGKVFGNMIVTSILSDDVGKPRHLFLYTKDGLRRVIRPEGGWAALGCRPEGSLLKNAEGGENKIFKTAPKKNELETLNFFGRGFGHQVGMCQSGAIELGKQGSSYRQILALYYSNVALRSLGY